MFIKSQQEKEKLYLEKKFPYETPYLNFTNNEIKVSEHKIQK